MGYYSKKLGGGRTGASICLNVQTQNFQSFSIDKPFNTTKSYFIQYQKCLDVQQG